jgi:NTE family protein
MKKNKLGLALGGGGARGLSHIGVLKVLEREGVKIDYIAGTSIGAIIGSLYALGYNAKQLEAEAMRRSNHSILIEYVDISFKGQGIMSGKKITKHFDEMYQGKTFKDLKIPLQIVCTDLEVGTRIALKQGKISEAVRASMSVPGIFPPLRIDGKLLADGGVIDPTPIDVVKKMGATSIIAIDLVMQQKKKIFKPTIYNTLMRSFEIARTQTVKDRIIDKNIPLVIIKPKMSNVMDSFKFSQVKELIKAGEEATEKALEKIKNL